MTSIVPVEWKRMQPPRESELSGLCRVCGEVVAQWGEALYPDASEQLPSLARGFVEDGHVWEASTRHKDRYPLRGRERIRAGTRLGIELPSPTSPNVRGPKVAWGSIVRCRKCRVLVELLHATA